MQIHLYDWLQAADHEVELRRWRDESKKGEYKTAYIEHDIKGVSPEAIAWYFLNFETSTYRLWHPAHYCIQWERKTGTPGDIHIAWENINGKMAAYRIRLNGPLERCPIKLEVRDDSMLTEILDTDGNPVLWSVMENIPQADGFRANVWFIFPEATPDSFVEAHRQHNIEEVQGLCYEAVPTLIKRVFGYAADPKKLKEAGLVVPVEIS